jgi:hypothetical protein
MSPNIGKKLLPKSSALYVRTTTEEFDIEFTATEVAAKIVKGNTPCQSRLTGRSRD